MTEFGPLRSFLRIPLYNDYKMYCVSLDNWITYFLYHRMVYLYCSCGLHNTAIYEVALLPSDFEVRIASSRYKWRFCFSKSSPKFGIVLDFVLFQMHQFYLA